MLARFTVSGICEAQHAAPWISASSRQARISFGVVSGRAPSWMATYSLPMLFTACRPFHTEMCRSSPPLMTLVTFCSFSSETSFSTSSMPSSFVTMRISCTSFTSLKALTECQSTGLPSSGAKSLSKPMRRLLPAATMMALTMIG